MDRFMKARGGDHTLTAFQCPLCQCRNIKRRNLNDLWKDKMFECQVIRATLDAFWSRASGTLDGHKTEIRFQIKYGNLVGVDPMPRLGPWPLGADLGMKHAIMMECRSYEKGTHGREQISPTERQGRQEQSTLICGKHHLCQERMCVSRHQSLVSLQPDALPSHSGLSIFQKASEFEQES